MFGCVMKMLKDIKKMLLRCLLYVRQYTVLFGNFYYVLVS